MSFSAVKTEEKYSLKNLPISCGSTQRWQLWFLRGPIFSRVTLSCLMYIKPLWISICQSYLLLPLCLLISFLSKFPRGYILSNIIKVGLGPIQNFNLWGRLVFIHNYFKANRTVVTGPKRLTRGLFVTCPSQFPTSTSSFALSIVGHTTYCLKKPSKHLAQLAVPVYIVKIKIPNYDNVFVLQLPAISWHIFPSNSYWLSGDL